MRLGSYRPSNVVIVMWFWLGIRCELRDIIIMSYVVCSVIGIDGGRPFWMRSTDYRDKMSTCLIAYKV